MRNVQYCQDDDLFFLDEDDPNLVPVLLISMIAIFFICLCCIPEFLFLVGFFKMVLGIAIIGRDPVNGSALLLGASIWFAVGRVKLKQREQENMRRRQEQQGDDDEEEELGWRDGSTTQMTNMTSWREGRRQKNRREPVIGYGHINSKNGEEEEEEENQVYEIKNGQFIKKSRGHQGPMLMLKQSNALADDYDDKQEQSSTRSSGEEAQEDALLEKGLAMFANVVDDDDDAASGKGVGQFDEHKQTAKECKEEEEEEEEEEVRDDFSLMV